MLFLTLEDLTGTLDVIAITDVFQVAKNLLRFGLPILITSFMERGESRDETYLRVEKVEKLG